MFITNTRSANKVKDLLFDVRSNTKDKKQVDAIDAAMDLIDDLLIEGRWS